MGAGSTCAVLAAVCCLMFLPFVLQTVGMFTPMWGSNSTCDSIGLVYSCCSGSDNTSSKCGNTNGGDELDVRALGLQATSFAVMFLTVFCLCCGSCCNDNNDEELGWCQTLGGCCFMLFPVAGLFSVIGCIIVATKFSTSMLGYSFYLCLVAGCYVILVTIILCCCVCKMAKNDDGNSPQSQPSGGDGSLQPYNSGGISPYEPSYQVQQASIHRAVAVHDEETGGIVVFMQRMNITRIVGSFRQ